ncbi:DUF2057 domain-containing protein [Marinomonas rhizomae]|uniref:YccT family protein n=1 Tax=Marinomonas rhizomae TaxID=491948 RepID=UPI002105BEF5|nr:DUF2057 domain-containing protein [Marinomonas rhizomae]UTW00540.1 DUF2057 domain-containing protein [Marinomonas rhizomae]
MKIRNYAISFGILLGSFTALPAIAASFEVPRSFEIMYVDLESASQFGNDFKVDLDEGQHQIVVRFNKLLRSGGDTHEYQSEPVVLDLQFTKNGYLILKAPYISNQKQAEANAKDPQFTIYDDVTGQDVDYKKKSLTTKSGLQNTRDYVSEIEKVTATKTLDSMRSDSGPVRAPILMAEDVALGMMQFWYNESDELTRKDARIWIADNMYKPKVANTQLDMFQFWVKKADKEAKKEFQAWLLK